MVVQRRDGPRRLRELDDDDDDDDDRDRMSHLIAVEARYAATLRTPKYNKKRARSANRCEHTLRIFNVDS